MRQNSINMIFAVTAEQIGVYELLGKHIEGASSGILSNNSENVVELVKDQYSVWHVILNTLDILWIQPKLNNFKLFIVENIIFCWNEGYSIKCNTSYILF